MTEGDMQQHLAAMIESFDSKFHALGERQEAMYQAQQATNQKLDQLVNVVDRINMRVDILETRFERFAVDTQQRFDKLETCFDKLETRFDGFAVDTQSRLERVESHLQLNGSHAKSSPRLAPRSAAKPGKTRTAARSGKKR